MERFRAAHQAPQVPKKFRVLLLDDQKADVEGTVKLLKSHFPDYYEFEGAINYEEALEKLKQEKFDRILLDIAMPDLMSIKEEFFNLVEQHEGTRITLRSNMFFEMDRVEEVIETHRLNDYMSEGVVSKIDNLMASFMPREEDVFERIDDYLDIFIKTHQEELKSWIDRTKPKRPQTFRVLIMNDDKKSVEEQRVIFEKAFPGNDVEFVYTYSYQEANEAIEKQEEKFDYVIFDIEAPYRGQEKNNFQIHLLDIPHISIWSGAVASSMLSSFVIPEIYEKVEHLWNQDGFHVKKARSDYEMPQGDQGPTMDEVIQKILETRKKDYRRSLRNWFAAYGPQKPKKVNVLIAEDDPEQLKRRIEEFQKTVQDPSQFNILTATNYEEALNLLVQNECEAVLFDLVMPDKSDRKVDHTLRGTFFEELKKVKVVTMISGFDAKTALDNERMYRHFIGDNLVVITKHIAQDSSDVWTHPIEKIYQTRESYYLKQLDAWREVMRPKERDHF